MAINYLLILKNLCAEAHGLNPFSLTVKIIIAIVLILAVVLGLVKACEKDDEKENKKDKKPVAEVIKKQEEDKTDDNGLKSLEDNGYVYVSNLTNEVKKSSVKQVVKEEVKNVSKEEVKDTKAPVVTGVSEGEVGSVFVINAIDDKTSTNNLVATIDGMPYTLGEEYRVNGNHTLVVKDEALNVTVINFTIVTKVNANDSLNAVIANANDGDIILLNTSVNENIIINKSITIIGDGNNINGYLNITNGDVTLENIVVKNTLGGINYNGNNKTLIKVETNGKFVMKNSKIEGNTSYTRNGITINNASKVEMTGNIFEDANVYNYIEYGANTVATNGTNISNNRFSKGSCTHNHINIYNFENNAVININDNYFAKSANAIRLSNRNNAVATINMMNDRYDETDSNYGWAGLFLIQPWDASLEDFSTITINVENLIGPSSVPITNNIPNTIDQIYYIWNTTSTPIVNVR